MSWFTERIQAAIGRVRQVTSQSVTYRRGAASVAIDAVPGSTPVETFQSFGVHVDATWRDWLIIAVDLEIGGMATEPQAGDVIEEASGERWQVLPIEGQRQWRPSDGESYQIRVHTKLISDG